jgi:hypothetical protein
MGSSSFGGGGGTFLSSSNRFSGGPPKTLSPMLLPQSPSGYRPDPDRSIWSLKCLSIPPKMIHCGTNTEPPTITITDDKSYMNNNNNNKVVVNQQQKSGNSMMTPFPQLKNDKNYGTRGKNTENLRLADLLAQSRPVNSVEFKFEKPLSLGDVDKYLRSNQFKKHANREEESSSLTSSSSSSDMSSAEDTNEDDGNKMSNHHKIPNGVISESKKDNKSESFNSSTTSATTTTPFQWNSVAEKQ